MRRETKRYTMAFLILAALLVTFLVWNLNAGSYGISVAQVMQIFLGNGSDATASRVVWDIRLPRVLAAILLGGALSVAGFLLQTFFANPIAGPFVLGISSGAKMTVALTMIFFLEKLGSVSGLALILAAFAGSLLSVADAAETEPSLWTAFAGMFPTMGACVAFGAFNLLCAPCFAAMGTIRNQMDSGKWTAIALGYECAFAWVIGLFINQFYNLLVLGQFGIWTVVAIVLLVAMLFQIFRPMPKHAWTDEDETNTASAAVSA